MLNTKNRQSYEGPAGLCTLRLPLAYGAALQSGDGVARDYPKALTWFRKAAAAGDTNAMYDIGMMVAGGQGVDANENEGLSWMRKAADAGNTVAIETLGRYNKMAALQRQQQAQQSQAQQSQGLTLGQILVGIGVGAVVLSMIPNHSHSESQQETAAEYTDRLWSDRERTQTHMEMNDMYCSQQRQAGVPTSC